MSFQIALQTKFISKGFLVNLTKICLAFGKFGKPNLQFAIEKSATSLTFLDGKCFAIFDIFKCDWSKNLDGHFQQAC